ncbi:hypothetical protein DFH07DRAFT_810045 [Mycena maculata]|uniref:Uncharacterized protein n=1 Tax=Mycena maculata TaxID=230809 RepID=A0AAD7NKR5_9AGAR|nr:hypothetical protein DFH07DRAFT_810045 [Mycena maculata]
MPPVSMTSNTGVFESASNGAAWSTSTVMLAIPTTDAQAQVTQAPTKTSRVALIGLIVGVVLGSIVVVAVLVLVWRLQRRRKGSVRPMLIEDDAVSKDGSERASMLPVYTHLSPFPMSPGRPRMSPLRIDGQRRMSERPSTSYSSRPSTHRKSSSYYPTSPETTERTGSPVMTQRTSTTRRPASSYQPGYRDRASKYQRVSHHRKLSYDLPSSSSPLSYQAPTLPKARRASYFQDSRPTSTHDRPSSRGTPTPSAARRLELQVELETALSETVYEKDEPETPAKTPTRRNPLRCMSEPRPLSSEYGSIDSHKLG